MEKYTKTTIFIPDETAHGMSSSNSAEIYTEDFHVSPDLL